MMKEHMKMPKEERKNIVANIVKKKIKKQTPDDREDESLGMKRGKESGKMQSYKSRRDESKMRRK